MTVRGRFGRNGADYDILFTRAGVDLGSAGPEDYLFRTDIEMIRPLVKGSVSIGNGVTSTITLPKTFNASRFPIILAAMDNGDGTMDLPQSDFIVRMRKGASNFTINNSSGATRTFHYVVWDNEIGTNLIHLDNVT
jgi:hypothetical protein